MATDRWGIDDGYHDVDGRWHAPPPDSVAAFRRAMGAPDADDPSGSPPPGRPLWMVRAGSADALHGPVELRLEDGTTVQAEGHLPPDLPLGYHDLWPLAAGGDGNPTRLIVSPGRCHRPADKRTWGIAVQLYAARSRQSWGIGDFADLRTLVAWARHHGAHVLGLNPLHAPRPTTHPEPSPYSPSSRRWLNPLYLRIEDIAGAEAEPGFTWLAAAGHALNARNRIDRDAVWQLKSEALDGIWSRFQGDPRFDRFVADHGDDLAAYATFCALAEHHDRGWRDWPHEHRRPDGPGVAEFAARHADRIRFHSWLQWLLDDQLMVSGAGNLAITDLAVGVDPGGADAWQWQDLMADGIAIGAPPDEFNTQGQDWGLPPFVPWRLRDAGYEPFARTVRAGLRHGRGLRVDHVMGLFRLFWVPAQAGPRAGGYVRFPAGELLDVLALESARAGAFVVGEDLGTVEPEVRAALHDAAVLSTRVLWFEPGEMRDAPADALATVTTHDLTTVAGLWSGADLAAQERLGLQPNLAGTAEMRQHLAEAAGVPVDAPVADAIIGAHRVIGESPARLAVATLDDLLAAPERPNMPGTTTEWPNWSIPLPVPIDDLDAQPLVTPVIDALRATRPDTY
ncbi:MAG TPA: 4-alpha-glucanotransferase [Acidimicrobiales bacterium]